MRARPEVPQVLSAPPTSIPGPPPPSALGPTLCAPVHPRPPLAQAWPFHVSRTSTPLRRAPVQLSPLGRQAASAPWNLLPLLPSAPSPRSPQLALTSSAPCPSPAGSAPAPPWEAESSSTSAPQRQVPRCWGRPPAHVGPRAGAACSHFQPHFLASPRLPQVPAASGEPGPGFLPPAPAERTVVDKCAFKQQPPSHPPLCLPASGVGRESNRVPLAPH